MNRLGVFASLGFCTLTIVACSVADIEGTTLDQDNATPAPSKAPAGCVPKGSAKGLQPTDPETLPKCACAKGGAARCVAKSDLPESLAAQLEGCSDVAGGGACVPDPLVKSGGGAPPTCKSPFGEGRCMSLCVPEVAKNAQLLDRGEGDTCAEDERCAPCTNPLKNNAPTGVCEIGTSSSAPVECEDTSTQSTPPGGGTAPAGTCPYEGPPVVDVTMFPACGDGARCVPEGAVPAESASMLKKCPTGLCAPEKSIAAGGQYLPKTCASVAGAEGRCVNVNVPAVESQKDQLPQDACDANERCAPCFNPGDGKETGACRTVSCDAPKKPAVTFASCCKLGGSPRGKCVPISMVPASSRSRLDDEDCVEGKELCAPAENLDPTHKATACNADSFVLGKYTGVCVSNCVKFGIQGVALARGNCSSVQTCAPCVQGGKPTGAPGCPGSP
ncbi:MAG: hypothetical protein KF819_19980 [Labilithrix sp.]|nr:hypothetical protein [Labilithrix sp.]